jgi:signal transduction histidine kinase/ligand-binding sensor domain-containing protein
MLELRNGCLAVGTLDRGLYLMFPDKRVRHFNRSNGLPHDWIRCLCEDREGNLWAGAGSGGLVALRPARVTTINPPDNWQGRAVLSVTSGRDGALWVGTEGAGLYRLRDGQWNRFADAEGVQNLFVWSVAEDEAGRLWAGTWGGGLLERRESKFQRAAGLDGVTLPMPALLADGEELWAGTSAGLMRYRNGKAKWYGRDEGLDSPDVRAVAKDATGTVWFGMYGGGLGKFENGVCRQFRKRDGLSSDFVQCLLLDPDGSLWVGTADGGLNRLKSGRFSVIGARQGLLNNVICDIADDGRGFLWMSTHGGILRISRDELVRCADGEIATVQCRAYGRSDGLPTLECSGGLQPAGCRTPDGKLWFTTSKGLVTVDPASVSTNLLAPPVVIEEVLIDDQPIAMTKAPSAFQEIPPGQQRFEFHYAGLSFVAPEKVQFKYRLEGLNTDWIDRGTKRSVDFSYLPPGDYRFQVKACNNDGVWNESGASWAFTVLPFFWQTWWFRGIAWSAALSLAAGIVLYSARRRMHRQIERAERQHAVERERARIAQDMHDDLGASLTRITLLSESARGELGDSKQAAAEIDRISDTARELTRSLDEIVWAVNPRHDTLDSLASYLGRFAQGYVAAAGLRCRLDLPVRLPPWLLTAEMRHNLFLAFKEALHNILKHADASEVRISLVLDRAAFALTVEDDGRGFEQGTIASEGVAGGDRIARGNGMRNMRRRLSEFGGQCEIDSLPEKGTRVTFVVAVPQSTK